MNDNLYGAEGIGVGRNIRFDNNGLVIEAQSINADNYYGRNYFMLDNTGDIRGYIT